MHIQYSIHTENIHFQHIRAHTQHTHPLKQFQRNSSFRLWQYVQVKWARNNELLRFSFGWCPVVVGMHAINFAKWKIAFCFLWSVAVYFIVFSFCLCFASRKFIWYRSKKKVRINFYSVVHTTVVSCNKSFRGRQQRKFIFWKSYHSELIFVPLGVTTFLCL